VIHLRDITTLFSAAAFFLAVLAAPVANAAAKHACCPPEMSKAMMAGRMIMAAEHMVEMADTSETAGCDVACCGLMAPSFVNHSTNEAVSVFTPNAQVPSLITTAEKSVAANIQPPPPKHI
jgi:hypothetical protein